LAWVAGAAVDAGTEGIEGAGAAATVASHCSQPSETPSPHDSDPLGSRHCPVAGSQPPGIWQAGLVAHHTGLPTHTPAWQTSSVVHASPSPHALPSAFAGFEQIPVAGSQVPASWHESLAAQTTGSVPTHAPA